MTDHEQPTRSESVLNHPSLHGLESDDCFETIEELRAEGRLTEDEAQDAHEALMIRDNEEAAKARRGFRLVLGTRQLWSRHGDKPDLRLVRPSFRRRRWLGHR